VLDDIIRLLLLLLLLLLKEAVLCSKCAVTNCFYSTVIVAVFWTVSTFLDSYKHKML